MKQLSTRFILAIAVLTLGATVAAAQFTGGGTHVCDPGTGSNHTCVVSGSIFGTCIEAADALKLQDCCPGSQVCRRDATTGQNICRLGGKSIGFTLNYCFRSGRL